jgi:hypothetical protein
MAGGQVLNLGMGVLAGAGAAGTEGAGAVRVAQAADRVRIGAEALEKANRVRVTAEAAASTAEAVEEAEALEQEAEMARSSVDAALRLVK